MAAQRPSPAAKPDADPALPVERRTVSLTQRERDVLNAVGRRLLNQEIADELVLSKRTVEDYVSSLYRKLGVSTRRDLVTLGRRLREGRHSPDASSNAARAQGDPSAYRWVEFSIRQTSRQIARTREHIAQRDALVERNRRRTRGVGTSIARARGCTTSTAESLTARTQREAIHRHESAARRLEQLARALELAALGDRDEQLRRNALDVAARARERADASRTRAAAVRRRLLQGTSAPSATDAAATASSVRMLGGSVGAPQRHAEPPRTPVKRALAVRGTVRNTGLRPD